MDGWMKDRWVALWMDGWMDGQTGREMRQIIKQLYFNPSI
jgi:hypothetical protein